MGRQLRCAVAVSRMYQARPEAGRLFGRCERASLKVRPRIAPGPLLLKAPSTLERMSILAAAFRTSTALSVGINVALTRWIHRVAFVGTAALARPCSHAFFMFRFLARGSAGTDVSFTGRAGLGLDAISVEPKSDATTRAEIVNLDRIRSLLGYRDELQTLGRRLSPARGNIVQISFFCFGRPIGCRLRCVLRSHQELAIRDH